MHERISINALCFPGAKWTELAAYWGKLEPRCVSLLAAQLPESLSLARATIDGCGYRLEALTHLFKPGPYLNSKTQCWDEERARLNRLIDVAAALGSRSIYMLTGGRGTLTWEEAAECFSAAIAPCVVHAQAARVELMVENASPLYADIHVAHSLRDTVALAEMAGIGVCIDICACWTEAGLRKSIERAIPRCHLIQVSDYVYGDRALPSRAVPGDGNIPIGRILDWALSAGYSGIFDLEMIGPRLDKEGNLEATRRGARWVGDLLHSLGA